jgi:hypothetical protein
MRSDLGRFFEGHILETVNVMKTIYDAGTGAGKDVSVSIDGRELVFTKGDAGGRGFLRMIPGEVAVRIAFPKGSLVFDPEKRAKGYPGSQTSFSVAHPSEIDTYVRRMIDAAYALET